MPSLRGKWIAGLCLTVVVILSVQSGSVRGADDGKFSGEYRFFSGEVGEMGQPTQKDAKVGLSFSGALAQRMYRNMGAAAHTDACSGDDKEDIRIKGNLLCSRDKVTGKAECDVGIDIHSGKSVLSIDPC